jgi:hypothetical protein
MATLGGCGGSAAPVANGTNAGIYQATVTGSIGATTASGLIALTVN